MGPGVRKNVMNKSIQNHSSSHGGNDMSVTAGVNPLVTFHRRLRGKYRYAVPVGCILGLSAAFAVHSLIPDQYESTGVLEIAPTSQRVLYSTEQNEAVPMFDAWVDAQLGQIRSPRVIDLAMKNKRWTEQGVELNRNDFLEDLSISRANGSLLISISYVADDKYVAQAAVQSTIEAYRSIHIDQSKRGQVWTVETLQALVSELNLQRKELRNRVAAVSGPRSASAIQDLYDAKFQEQIEIESMLTTARLELAAFEVSADNNTEPKDDVQASKQTGVPDGPQVMTAEELANADTLLAKLVEARDSEVVSLDQLVTTYGENHPEADKVRYRLLTLDRGIEKRTNELNKLIAAQWSDEENNPGITSDRRGIRGPEVTIDTLTSRIETLTELRDEVKQQAESLNFDLNKIEEIREDEAMLMKQAKDAEQRLAALQIEQENSGRVNVLNEGEIPAQPSNKKRRLQMTGAAGLVGFGLPLGVAFLIGQMRGRYDHFDDAKATLGSGAFLGILPHLPENMAEPEQALVASLSVHEIRSLLHGVSDQHDAKSFMITSATSGSGKTTLALALGLSYAGAGSKTLVIDFDTVGAGLSSRIRRIVRGRLGRMLIEQGLLDESQLILAVETAERDGRKLGETLVDLNFISDGQLSDALNRQASQNYGLREAITSGDLENCVTETGIPNLDALPVGETSVGDVGTFPKHKLRTLLDQARKHYDMILIDTGPILGSLEASMLSKEVDATVLVLAAGEQERLVNQALERLQQNNAVLAGLIFNRAKQKDVVRFSSSASQRSRLNQNMEQVIKPQVPIELPGEYGPIAEATASFQPKRDN